MKPTRPLATLAAATMLLTSGLLSGCGLAGTSISPGVAVAVGDRDISIDRVEELASAYCSAIAPQLQGQALPNSYLTSGVAGQLALAEAARQLAEEHGVQPGADYRKQLAELERAVETIPEDQQEAVIEVESAGALVAELVIGVGEKLADEQGLRRPGREQVAALGNQALAEWVEENGVEVNPVYGFELRDGQPVPVDTNTSVAVGDVATSAIADAPDPEYAASLPESQRCS